MRTTKCKRCGAKYGTFLHGVCDMCWEARAVAAEAEVERMRIVFEEIHSLTAWQCDDDADEDDESPGDMTAHINGLIRQKCSAALRAVHEKGGE